MDDFTTLQIEKFDSRDQIAVRRRKHGDVVRVLPGEPDHVSRDQGIDALFLRCFDRLRAVRAVGDLFVTDGTLRRLFRFPLSAMNRDSGLFSKPSRRPSVKLSAFLCTWIVGGINDHAVERVAAGAHYSSGLLRQPRPDTLPVHFKAVIIDLAFGGLSFVQTELEIPEIDKDTNPQRTWRLSYCDDFGH